MLQQFQRRLGGAQRRRAAVAQLQLLIDFGLSHKAPRGQFGESLVLFRALITLRGRRCHLCLRLRKFLAARTVHQLIEPVLQLADLGSDAGAVGSQRTTVQLGHQLALLDRLPFAHRHGDDLLVGRRSNLESVAFDGAHRRHVAIAGAGGSQGNRANDQANAQRTCCHTNPVYRTAPPCMVPGTKGPCRWARSPRSLPPWPWTGDNKHIHALGSPPGPGVNLPVAELTG